MRLSCRKRCRTTIFETPKPKIRIQFDLVCFASIAAWMHAAVLPNCFSSVRTLNLHTPPPFLFLPTYALRCDCGFGFSIFKPLYFMHSAMRNVVSSAMCCVSGRKGVYVLAIVCSEMLHLPLLISLTSCPLLIHNSNFCVRTLCSSSIF